MLLEKVKYLVANRQFQKARKQWEILSLDFAYELSLSQSLAKYRKPNEAYRYFHQYFYHRCPQIIRDHRKY
ncbi:MAG: hypothetical protein ACYTX0_41250, partial [Nostoc sp.]